MTLLHSGTLYPGSDRDPGIFLTAIRRLFDENFFDGVDLRIIFRACGYEGEHRHVVGQLKLDSVVFFEPSISYLEALTEMMTVDGLLLFQGYTSNPAIPAKLYEYLRAQRPILGLLDSEGETAQLMDTLGAGYVAPINDVGKILAVLETYLSDLIRGTPIVLAIDQVDKFSRNHSGAEFQRLIESTALN